MRNFDDDPTLAELLPPERQRDLLQMLQSLTGKPFALSEQLRGDAERVEFNLDGVGWLSCAADARLQAPAARLVEFILTYVGKYRLAANLHHDIAEASFAELQRQHAALQESETRYRQLSEQLQVQVAAQVKVIEQTQQELYESARLRAIGQLAAGVAHEINNPIGFISSNLRVAEDYINEIKESIAGDSDFNALIEDFQALLKESASGTQRIASIVADLKTFSNIDQADFIACDINDLLRTSCHLLQAEFNHVLNIELQLGDIEPISGYPAKLSQVFYNVLDNAAKAVEEKGRIRVISRRSVKGQPEVVIEDNGCGIPAVSVARIFDPFFTTRPVGAGTGLGLAVARETMMAHQGEVSIRSREGIGTRVTLKFG
ncbi:sensor histidine kinase [Stutzerimonas nitrititolerans]|uniref:sensor histidine kinase n=1 Tax=Stutzerimonas nitrititolerans TaxID=2482751 RepID=UPI00289A2113|nr:ATP-binding protein [Stutzerimonas nitrititolerans]